jgi:transcriptional regulator with XRE-family HTH domain
MSLHYLPHMAVPARNVGDHLREWRQRRRLSQLALASEAEISPRHLSFVETGRSVPSREMILHLEEQLQIPMRERNVLLVAGGYAPIFPERALNSPALAAARAAIDIVLESQKPFPAFALDRHWNVVASNSALQPMYEGVAGHLMQNVNAMRISLHPEGLAPRIVNLPEWRAHLLARLKQQADLTADPELIALQAEVTRYPAPQRPHPPADPNAVLVPLKIRVGADVLSFFSTTTVFGTPVDVTLAELAVESFFPADEETATSVRRLSA